MSSRTSGCSPATPSSFASAAAAPVHPTVNIERFSVALTCWVLMLAAPAFAQGIAGGLFGATRPDESGRDRLNVQASMAGGLDSEVPPEAGSLVPPGDFPSGGRSTTLAASADYARNRRSVQLFGNASTYFRYAQGLDRIAMGSQSGQLGAGVRLPNQGTLRITQSAAYSPFYLYELFPTGAPLATGEAIPVNPEYRIVQTDSLLVSDRNVTRVRVSSRNSFHHYGRLPRHRFRGAAGGTSKPRELRDRRQTLPRVVTQNIALRRVTLPRG